MLGKKAAAQWSGGEHANLTEAVVHVIKHAEVPLVPEQVRRVLEFCNVDAYLSEFRKEGAHKIVDFGPDGPANPADVLHNLNNGGGTTVLDNGISDYSRPPAKTASYDDADEVLAEVFMHKAASVYPDENPYQEIMELQDKLAGAYDHLSAQISGLEIAYQDLSEGLYQQVKQASLEGQSLGEIIQAWGAVTDDPIFVKAAFDQFVPRLLKEEVFYTGDDVGNSILKTAGERYVNIEHPLINTYTDFVDVLSKLASLREWQEEVFNDYNQATAFISACMRKEGTGGWYQKVHDPFAKGLEHVGLGPTGAKLVAHAGMLAPVALGANALYQKAKEKGFTSYVPGTKEYKQYADMADQLAQQHIMSRVGQ